MRRFSEPATGQVARWLKQGFSLAELLVVVGIVALLLATILPPLQLARHKAQQTACSARLQQLGHALESARSEHGYYPLWDDGGAPIRYTWIDVLIQQRLLGTHDRPVRNSGDLERDPASLGYCPSDRMPDALNTARHNDLIYPPTRSAAGIDYSYGIGVPLSAGGWAWRAGQTLGGEPRPRRFRDHELQTAGRVLAGDAWTSAIYNLSGYALRSGIWNDRTQYDNTVAWGRHARSAPDSAGANLLFQDGHVSLVRYLPARPQAVNTTQVFLWYPGEPLDVGPEHSFAGDWYPHVPPPGFQSTPPGSVFPLEMTPAWYTRTHRWTLIAHK